MAKPHKVRVKICGMTRPEDALKAVELGADAIGLIFYKKSPRAVNEKTAREIIRELPPLVNRVGVFVNETVDRVNLLADKLGLDVVQLHGDETPAYCKKIRTRVLKAVRVKDENSLSRMSRYSVSGFLLDAFHPSEYGGTGEVFDWRLAKKAKKHGPIILAGGLNAQNVAEAIDKVKPYGVDVCSGVEKIPGQKDYKKLRAFFNELNSIDQE